MFRNHDVDDGFTRRSTGYKDGAYPDTHLGLNEAQDKLVVACNVLTY